MDKPNKTILYFVTEDWYFCSHRLTLALAAKDAGYEVKVLTRVCEHGAQITESGLDLIPFEIDRHGLNPVDDLRLLFRLCKVYRRVRPDIVHHVAMKPVLYGSIAAWLAGIHSVVNALAGMGYLFSADPAGGRALLRKLVTLMFSVLFKQDNIKIIVQNPDDCQLLAKVTGISKKRIALIKGSGVNTDLFRPRVKPDGVVLIALVARMLWDKGVGEFVEAAQILHGEGIEARFVLIGNPDVGNPAAVDAGILEAWQEDDIVEWWGQRDDMVEVLKQTDIACLPSYREGLPKSLLEAAAAGLPIVTTDVVGCKEVVEHEKNGLLVPVKDSRALAEALGDLINSPGKREKMGRQGRIKVEREFSDKMIIKQTLALYQEACQ